MKHIVIAASLAALGGIASPETAQAQLARNLFNPCCNTCGHQVCTCARTRPVVETRMREQKCVTYQDRKRIACRTEPVCETVPVTKVDCVTVDEGCYQMVWVPKPVAKAVPRTEYHQRVSYRTVPFEVCEKVPVVTSHLVPEQTIRYVTEHTTVTSTAPVPFCAPTPACPPACPPGGGVGFTPGGFGIPSLIQGGYGRPAMGFGAGPGGGPSPVASPYSVMRESNGPSSVASAPDATPQATAGLVPDAGYADPHAGHQHWTSVPSRNATAPAQRYAETPMHNTAMTTTGASFRSPTAAPVFQMRRPAAR